MKNTDSVLQGSFASTPVAADVNVRGVGGGCTGVFAALLDRADVEPGRPQQRFLPFWPD